MLMTKMSVPCPKEHFNRILDLLKFKKTFTFVRFSDGETEILHNRYLEINKGQTFFRGRVFDNNFPDFDSKRFDPIKNRELRSDLLESAMYRNDDFYKGIPTQHNGSVIDREFMLRLNGGQSKCMTFSDLFLNSNYNDYRKKIVPLFKEYTHTYVVANYRSKLCGELSNSHLIKIPDNFFATYKETLKDVFHQLINIESGSLVLCSASSLTNIIGYKLALVRKDITLIDIGTSVNDLLSLNSKTRAYHSADSSVLSKIKYKSSKGYQIKW